MSCTPRKEITNIYQLRENYGDDFFRQLRMGLYSLLLIGFGYLLAMYYSPRPINTIEIIPNKCICEVNSFTPHYLPIAGSSN